MKRFRSDGTGKHWELNLGNLQIYRWCSGPQCSTSGHPIRVRRMSWRYRLEIAPSRRKYRESLPRKPSKAQLADIHRRYTPRDSPPLPTDRRRKR